MQQSIESERITNAQIALCLLGMLAFAVGATVSFVAFGALLQLAEAVIPDLPTTTGAVVPIVGAVIGGFLLARKVARAYARRTGADAAFLKSDPLFWLVVGFYFLTWVAGAPAVQSANTDWAIRGASPYGYELPPGPDGKVPAERGRYPALRTYASVPVLPLVVLSFHDYQVGPLAGWGGWDFQLWVGARVIRLHRMTYWIS